MYFRERDLQSVTRLWRELSEFPASKANEALEHCLKRLISIVGASNASWLAAVREPHSSPNDPMRGWWPHDIHVLHDADAYARQNAEILEHFKGAAVDPQSAAMIEHAGRTRAHLRSALVDEDTWQRSWLYQDILRPLHMEDRMVGAHTVTGRAESYFALDRGKTDKPFDERARNVFALFLSGNPIFHREQLLERGRLEAHSHLTPREQEVVRLLLTDRGEAEIADALGLTFNTAHQYVVSIFRKFGVQGRAGLTSQWLRFHPEAETE